jgi:hypothetical protein
VRCCQGPSLSLILNFRPTAGAFGLGVVDSPLYSRSISLLGLSSASLPGQEPIFDISNPNFGGAFVQIICNTSPLASICLPGG